MQEISNSLRQRLGARPVPQDHPDADTMAAYTEQVLPAAERTKVLLHLSQCNYCREVLSYSLPLDQPGQQVQSVFARSRFWIPAFRWGAAVATVAIATTLLVEKPWKTTPLVSPQHVELSQPAQPVQPAPPAETGSHPSVTPNSAARTSATLDSTMPVGGASGPARTPETRPAQRLTATPPGALAIIEPAVQPVLPPPPRIAASRPALAAASQNAPLEAANKDDAGQDWVNKNALRHDNSSVNGNLGSDAAGLLPTAPVPQGANGQGSGTRSAAFPAVALGDVGNRAMALEVVPPKTAPATGGSAGDTSLSKSSGFGYKLKSTIGTAVSAVKKAGAAQSGGNSFSTRAVMGPNLRQAAAASPDNNADAEDANQAQGPSQFRISNGILMKSTDYTRWHVVYPQGSDLQLKVVVPKGDDVWAGGNNGTLIHSWDAGVDWETLKVPDSGDITSITVDDGWQVKTSNGQTFVSQDKGKTWVPLQAQPK